MVSRKCELIQTSENLNLIEIKFSHNYIDKQRKNNNNKNYKTVIL